jgi:hypothetical protein
MPDAVTRAAISNTNLQVLDLTTDPFYIHWTSQQFVELLACLKVHKALCTLKINVHNDERSFGPSFVFLCSLLSRNRKLVITNEDGDVYADEEGVVDEIYSLNRFYLGSAEIVAFSSTCRAPLVTTTLVE